MSRPLEPSEQVARELLREAAFLSERSRIWLLEELRKDFQAADREQARIDELNKRMSEAVSALQRVAQHLKLRDSDAQLRLTKREFDAAPEKVRQDWTAHRVANAIRGSWEEAKGTAFTDRRLPVVAERKWEQREGLARKRQEAAFALGAVQRWLETDPSDKRKKAYERWARQENKSVRPDQRPIPLGEAVRRRWGLPFHEIVAAVEAGQVPGEIENADPSDKKTKRTRKAGTPIGGPDRERRYVLDPALRGRRLRETREAKGWTRRQLAAAIGVDQSSLGAIERGRVRQPSFEMIARIAEALDLSLDAFATND